MKKLYIDKIENSGCFSIFVKDAEVNWVGATVYSMSIKHKNSEYQRYATDYDIHFIFDDNIPSLNFYTIPLIDIFAVDSEGGYMGSLGEVINLEGDAPICYIDKDCNCFLIAKNGKEFLNNAASWKAHMIPYTDVEFFTSKEEAMKKYEFIDNETLNKMLT